MYRNELHNLSDPPYIVTGIESTRMRWAGYVARMRGIRNAYSVLLGKSTGKRPLGGPGSR